MEMMYLIHIVLVVLESSGAGVEDNAGIGCVGTSGISLQPRTQGAHLLSAAA